ncbi:nucleotide exchange factor GrpE [Ramlibacter sp.]|uniref:nucleotide exchange factor GrpE n=1 Tax=Ramlibacter sp. TaxID=1917967 RepID=UPI00180C2917|nr:nucleotide exchange factor GrpE [Ramlibacter sp.]MBA2676271.1 nucleotide exchange factor GrpE [Ramlibacter sp.]
MSENPQTENPAPEQAASAAPGATPQAADFAAAAPDDNDALANAQAELAALQAKHAELGEQVLRAQADMQNTRRRAEDEMSKARKFAVESFAESLLPVCDSLEAGLAHKDATAEQIREGAEATLRQLKSALERNRVTEINPAAAAKFDPHQHQAISVAPADQPPNTVVSVLQKGYAISERVLRPALVTVTAPK